MKKVLTKFKNGVIMSLVIDNHQESEVNNLTNTKLLEKKIRDSGLKKGYLADKCGLSRAGFRNCELNKAEFTTSQVNTLCEELGITSLREKETIFFAKNGD